MKTYRALRNWPPSCPASTSHAFRPTSAFYSVGKFFAAAAAAAAAGCAIQRAGARRWTPRCRSRAAARGTLALCRYVKCSARPRSPCVCLCLCWYDCASVRLCVCCLPVRWSGCLCLAGWLVSAYPSRGRRAGIERRRFSASESSARGARSRGPGLEPLILSSPSTHSSRGAGGEGARGGGGGGAGGEAGAEVAARPVTCAASLMRSAAT
jgi:hypothetical protein